MIMGRSALRCLLLLIVVGLALTVGSGLVRAAEPCQTDEPCDTLAPVAAAVQPTDPPLPAGANGSDKPANFVEWVSLRQNTYTHDAPAGRRIQMLYTWGTWLAIQNKVVVNGETWLETTSGRWVYGDDTEPWEPSRLRGYHYNGTETGQLGFILEDDTPVYAGPRQSAGTVQSLARFTPVFLVGRENGWWKLGPGQYVHPEAVREVKRAARPSEAGPDDKWIDINLTQQTVTAYVGNTPIFATLASTGKDPTPTITGVFHIYEKKIGEFMAGGWADKDPYILEEVPWTMYFTQRYAIHGAYWHDEYGEVRSHGCVNITPEDAKFLFTWAGPVVPPGQLKVTASPSNLGTWVSVHD